MTAIDYTCMYTVVGPDGTSFTLNNDQDPNFCGLLDTISGLDGAEVRENAQNRVAGDGGMHDNFYAGRMPFTLSGTVLPSVGSNVKQEIMQAVVSRARKQDAKLLWTPTGFTEERMIKFRNQQSIRFGGKVPKTFSIAGVAADYRVLSSAVQTAGPVSGTDPVVSVTNQGNEEADCCFIITGPLDGNEVIIRNLLTGQQIAFYSGLFSLPAPGVYPVGTMIINMNPLSLPSYLGYNVAIGGSPNNTDAYPFVDPLNTDWTIAAAPGPGAQNFELIATGTSGTTSLEVQWRDSWV